MQNDIKSGLYVQDESTTFSDWSKQWLEVYKANKAYNTYRMYESIVENHISKSNIANIPLKNIKTNMLQKLINNIAKDNKKRTAKITEQTIKQIFKSALQNDLIVRNPAEFIKAPKVDKPQKRTLTDIELEAIMNAPLQLREKAFLYLGLYAGLRRAEIYALTKKDINLKKKTININKNLVFRENQPEIKESPKTDAGFRQIPMSSNLYEVLNEYLPNIETSYLFTTQAGSPVTRQASRCLISKYNSILNKYLKKKYKDKYQITFTPHILRHTYATILYEAGIDIKEAQRLLGYKDIKVTLEIYTHPKVDNEETGNIIREYLENKI